MKAINKYILMLLFPVLIGCEYAPVGENFVIVSPPAQNIDVTITLNDVSPSDTIYVYQNTPFVLKIKSSRDLIKGQVFLDDQIYANISDSTVNFNIQPSSFTDGVHKIKANAVFTSGTGSLAEMLDMEGYEGELTWNVCIIREPQNHITTGYRINKDGFMEIYWKSTLPDNLFERYNLHSGLTQPADISITDPKQKSFVDYGYVCGYAYYEISIFMKGGYQIHKSQSVDITEPKNVYFESLGLDSLRVFWNKPYANGRFNLSCDGSLIASGITDTTFTITQLFGKSRQFSVEIRPRTTGYDNFHNRYTAWNWYALGTSLGLPNWELYALNTRDNILYTTTYGSLVAYNANTLEKINTINIPGNTWGLAYGGKLATAPHNSSIAAMTGEETYIFADSRFTNPIRISPLAGDVNTKLATLTSNDRFFVVLNGSNVCKVFSSLTGDLMTQIPFQYKSIYTYPDFDAVSEDGQYFCASSDSGIEIFKISGTTASVVYTDNRYYKGAMFVPSQPDKLLLRVGTDIEVRQMPGFNLIHSLDVTSNGALLCNIDPASLNLLYFRNDSLRVCKYNNMSQTLFKIRSNESTARLYNNKIFTYGKGGIYIDINTGIKPKTKRK